MQILYDVTNFSNLKMKSFKEQKILSVEKFQTKVNCPVDCRNSTIHILYAPCNCYRRQFSYKDCVVDSNCKYTFSNFFKKICRKLQKLIKNILYKLTDEISLFHYYR